MTQINKINERGETTVDTTEIKKKKKKEEEEEETENFNRPITRSEIESVSENLSINKTEKALRDMYHS